MKRRFAILAAIVLLSGTRLAAASPAVDDFDGIDRTRADAYAQGQLAFCKEPHVPLGPRQKELCSLAEEIPACEGFVKACRVEEPPKLDWLERFAELAAPVARVLLYAFVAVIVVALVVPIVLALRRRRRAVKKVAPELVTATVSITSDDGAAAAFAMGDAELALRSAEEHLQRGELKKALGLFLGASLSALDRRGAIRLARHRTNGEYVRACNDGNARPPLREIVREVERVTFGGEAPDEAGVRRVSAIASRIVRVSTTALVLLALGSSLTGCRAPRKGADPAGPELATAVLASNGYDVRPLESSLATIPIPTDESPAPVVIVDLEHVHLEEETRHHLVRWMEAGGTLVVLGVARPRAWEEEPRVEPARAGTKNLVVRAPRPMPDDDGDDDRDEDALAPLVVTGAKLARDDAFMWDSEGASTIASVGDDVYASRRRIGDGELLALANDDLFTNVGVMLPRNAAALVTIVRSATHTPARMSLLPPAKLGALRIARPEDGISPPSNPFSALLAAGLGRGIWHALAAALVLFLAYGIRLTRPRATARDERRKTAEHVLAMGAFYERARAHVHALAAYGRFVEVRLRELAPHGTEPAVYLATRSGASVERAREVFARATSAKVGDEPLGDELNLLDELRSMFARATGSPR